MEIRRKRTPYMIILVLCFLALMLGTFVNYKQDWEDFSEEWLYLLALFLASLTSLYFAVNNIVKIRLEQEHIYLEEYGEFSLADLNSIFLEEIVGYKGTKSRYLVFYFEEAGTISIPYWNLDIDLIAFDEALDSTTYEGEIGLEYDV